MFRNWFKKPTTNTVTVIPTPTPPQPITIEALDLHEVLHNGYKICKVYRNHRTYNTSKEKFDVYFYLLINKEGSRVFHFRANTLKSNADHVVKRHMLSCDFFNEVIAIWLSGYSIAGVPNTFEEIGDPESEFFKKLQGNTNLIIEDIPIA